MTLNASAEGVPSGGSRFSLVIVMNAGPNTPHRIVAMSQIAQIGLW